MVTATDSSVQLLNLHFKVKKHLEALKQQQTASQKAFHRGTSTKACREDSTHTPHLPAYLPVLLLSSVLISTEPPQGHYMKAEKAQHTHNQPGP